jgi:TM2 domain-containing membrane protein YozV
MSYPQNPPPAPPSTYNPTYPGHGDPRFQGMYPAPEGAPGKSFIVAWLLSLLLGSFGADRFYLGKIGTAVAKLLTAGGLGFWTLIDLVILLMGRTKDKNGRPLDGYREHKVTAIVITAVLWLLGLVVGVLTAMASMAAIQAGLSQQNPVPGNIPSVSAPAPGASTDASADPAAPGGEAGDSVIADMGNGNTARITIGRIAYMDQLDEYSEPVNGGYLVMEVAWETVEGETDANPLWFEASVDGVPGESAYMLEGQMDSATLAAGEQVAGYVAFDITKGNTLIELKSPADDTVAQFTIDSNQ